MRQDLDYLLTALAVSYGADVRMGTQIQDITVEAARVTILTAKGATYRATMWWMPAG